MKNFLVKASFVSILFFLGLGMLPNVTYETVMNVTKPADVSSGYRPNPSDVFSEKGAPFECKTESRVFSANENFIIDYYVDHATCLSIRYEYKDLEIASFESDRRLSIITMRVNNFRSDPAVSFNIETVYGSIESIVYFSSPSQGIIAFSRLSKEDAEDVLLRYKYDNSSISEDEYDGILKAQRTVLKSDAITLIEPMSNPFDSIINVRINWIDDYGVVHPAQFIRAVLMYNNNRQDTDTFYTDEYGEFDVVTNYSSKATLEVYTLNSDIGVRSSMDRPYYTKLYSVGAAFINLSDIEINIDMSDYFGKAMQIAQAAIASARYLRYIDDLDPDDPVPFCDFVFPHAPPMSEYSSIDKAVYITGLDFGFSQLPKSYASWDTIGHEYAHHLQHEYRIADNPGDYHILNINMIDAYMWGYSNPSTGEQLIFEHHQDDAVPKGLRISWAEGWATFFSICANRYYYFNYYRISGNINTVGDSLYTSSNGVVYDLDEYPTVFGDGSEAVVSCFLYKVSASDTTNDDYDTISILERSVWLSVKLTNAKILSTFILDLYNNERTNIWEVGTLLGKLGIAPASIELIYGKDASEPPTIRWVANGPATWVYNNNFEVIIYDGGGVPRVFKYPGRFPYIKLTEQEWSLLKVYSGISRIDVIGSSHQFRIVTGPYHSSGPRFGDISFSINNSDYNFPEKYNLLPLSQEISKTNDGKSYIFNANRLRAGKIDKKYIVLSPRQKSAGTAYLEYSFGFIVKRISVDLSMWSSDEMLYANTSSASIQYKSPQTGNWVMARDLLDGSLPYDKNAPLTYTVNFPSGVQEFRIYATSLQSGTNNKGRICVGEMTIN